MEKSLQEDPFEVALEHEAQETFEYVLERNVAYCLLT